MSTAISPFNEVVLVPSFLMKRWINYVMFSSLWLIADNDVWEVCQTGEHTGLPSGAGPRSGCVHLTNEMSRREDGATKRSLQTNSPQRWTAQTALNSLGSLHGLPTDHNPLEVHFQGMFGRREAARFVLAQKICPFVVWSSYWWSYLVHWSCWWSYRSTQMIHSSI